MIVDISKEILRFLSHVKRRGSCWIWMSARDVKGYGRFSFNGRNCRANRVSYEFFVGKIPPYMLACHKCDTPACVNPTHLFVGTEKDNANDMVAKKRGRFNPVRGLNHYKSIPATLLRLIKVSDFSRRGSVNEFCKQHCISRMTVHRIKSGTRYTDEYGDPHVKHLHG